MNNIIRFKIILSFLLSVTIPVLYAGMSEAALAQTSNNIFSTPKVRSIKAIKGKQQKRSLKSVRTTISTHRLMKDADIPGGFGFSASIGTFNSISATGDSVDTGPLGADDKTWDNIPIGFAFSYHGTSYTKVAACSNGWLSFDSTSTSRANGYDTPNDLAAATDIDPFITPLFGDLYLNGNIYYRTNGIAPNRTFTVEWNNVAADYKYGDGTIEINANSLSFQVVLYEGSGEIKFVYTPGPDAATTFNNPNGSGLCAGLVDLSGNFISINTLSTSATVSSTSESDTLNTPPSSGLTFSFVPRPYGSTLAASSVLSTSAIVHGMVYPMGSSINARFLFGTTSGVYTDSMNASPHTVTGSNPVPDSAMLTHLVIGRTYYYRIATLSGGNYMLGDEMSFTTLTPNAAAGPATNILRTSATLSGTVSPYNVSTSVRFLYGTASGVYTDSIRATPGTANGDTTTSLSAALSGLTHGTTYYYRISGRSTSPANYFVSDEQSFTTLLSANAMWGNALGFNGSMQYAHYGNVLTTSTANITLEGWVKWNGNPGGAPYGCILYNGTTNSSGYGLYIEKSTSYLCIHVGPYMANSSCALPVGLWTHVALTSDGSGNWTLYINGVDKYEAGFTAVSPSGDFLAGGNPNTECFNGWIDEVRFSNVVRYPSGFTPPAAPFTKDGNTIALYHFDEGSGSTAADSSDSHFDLTLVNSPAWGGLKDGTLPVQATDFIAKADVGSIRLSWKTQSEVNIAGFNILRKDPGVIMFTLIAGYANNGNLKGMGTSSSGRGYSYTDSKVNLGSTYQYKIQSVDVTGTTEDLTMLSVTVDAPKSYAVYQNYPNPFNPTTSISFDIPSRSVVSLKVFDLLGREVSTIVSGELQAGRYTRQWNATDISSGVYFYRLQAGAYSETKKLLLLK